MSKDAVSLVVEGLLNGKKPGNEYMHGSKSEQLAIRLAARIDAGVAPSLCAHAMCGSSAAGNVAVVKMLSQRPMSTFNKAYNFGEPLRRSLRGFIKLPDKDAFAECAKLIVAAGGDLYQVDKNSRSGMTAAGLLVDCGTPEALALLEELKRLIPPTGAADKPIKSEKVLEVKVEQGATKPNRKRTVEAETAAPPVKKRATKKVLV